MVFSIYRYYSISLVSWNKPAAGKMQRTFHKALKIIIQSEHCILVSCIEISLYQYQGLVLSTDIINAIESVSSFSSYNNGARHIIN